MTRINQICPACRQPKSACKATDACYKKAGWDRYQGRWIKVAGTVFDMTGNVLQVGDPVYILGRPGSHKIESVDHVGQIAEFICLDGRAMWEKSSNLKKAQIADDYNEGYGAGTLYAVERIKSGEDSTAEQYGDSMITELERLQVGPDYETGFKDGFKERLKQETGIDLKEGGRYYSRHAQALTYESGQAFAEEALVKGINTFGALQSELSSKIMNNLGEDTGPFSDGYWDFLKASGEVLDAEHIGRKAQADPFQVGQKIEDMVTVAAPYKWWTIVERSNDEVLIKLDDNPTIQERMPVSDLQQRIQNGQLKLASRQAQTLRESFERMVNEGQSFEEIGGFFGYDVTKREDALRLEEVLERFGPFASRQELENYLGRSLRHAQATEEEVQFATEVAKKVTEFAATEEDAAQLMELIKGKTFAKESRRVGQSMDELKALDQETTGLLLKVRGMRDGAGDANIRNHLDGAHSDIGSALQHINEAGFALR